ncbi:HD domain-containing protein [Rhodoluna sp.]|uniref:HD domain-containing protein n=1 Tax=Rhodoluna sp. TaxID=1969481 RepID=UPI0025FB5041|nr:HD domain-containing protein [Rhodoluna sp.]
MAASREVVNYLGREVTAKLPAPEMVPGLIQLTDRDAAIWQLAKDYLKTRDNDAHCLYAYGIANALLSQIPEAQENIVLPAILIHDIGWSTVDERENLEAIAPDKDGSRAHLIIQHEKEGAKIARRILTEVGLPASDIDEICDIIDGHDSRLQPISLNDSLVKDADKIWRVTPHGRRVVNDWFGLNDEQSLRLCAFRAYNELFTDAGRAMSRVLVSLACIDQTPQLSKTYRPKE